ncbi:hypothetical protein EBU91_04075 [bacterium]|nr:hypothetical protein [bacterium]
MSKYSRRLIISEQEKKEILKQYVIRNLIKEIEIKAGESITTKITFSGGKYLETSGNFSELTNNVTAIKDFCNKVPNGKIVEVVVEAGESQIPNTDNELNGKRVDVGYLSKKRYEVIKQYLTKTFDNWKKSDPNFKKPEKFVEIEPVIGATKWLDNEAGFCPSAVVNAKDPKDTQGYMCISKDFDPENGKENWKTGKSTTYLTIKDAFISEQFMKVTFRLGEAQNTVVEGPPKLECLSGMIIEYNYDSVVEISKDEKGVDNVHCCSRGKFNITANGIKLTRIDGLKYANINNHPDKKDLQEKQPDKRPQNEAGVANYYIYDTNSQTNITTPLCVHISDNGILQYRKNPKDPTDKNKYPTSIQKYLQKKRMDNYRYNTFKISAIEAQTIITNSKGQPGFLKIKAEGYEAGQHDSAARIIVKDPKGNIYFDSCIGGKCSNPVGKEYTVSYCNTGTSVF